MQAPEALAVGRPQIEVGKSERGEGEADGPDQQACACPHRTFGAAQLVLDLLGSLDQARRGSGLGAVAHSGGLGSRVSGGWGVPWVIPAEARPAPMSATATGSGSP